MSGLISSIAVTTIMATNMVSGGASNDIPEPPTLSTHVETQENSLQTNNNDLSYLNTTRSRGVASTNTSDINNNSDQNNLVVYKKDKKLNEDSIAGIDISSHQHTGLSFMDTSLVAKQGNVSFAYVKATEGTGYVNPYFRDDVIGFIKNNVNVGFYHYARPTTSTQDAIDQAQKYIAVTGINRGVKSLPPALDVEEDEGLSAQELSDWIDAFVKEIKKETGRDTIIYTYPSFWRDKMGNTERFKDLPLWIANYNNKDNPGSMFGGWKTWLFWQHTAEGNVKTATGDVDISIFNGEMDELDKMSTRTVNGKVKGNDINEPPKRKIDNKITPIEKDRKDMGSHQKEKITLSDLDNS